MAFNRSQHPDDREYLAYLECHTVRRAILKSIRRKRIDVLVATNIRFEHRACIIEGNNAREKYNKATCPSRDAQREGEERVS